VERQSICGRGKGQAVQSRLLPQGQSLAAKQ
jgi:hypothetical protein